MADRPLALPIAALPEDLGRRPVGRTLAFVPRPSPAPREKEPTPRAA